MELVYWAQGLPVQPGYEPLSSMDVGHHAVGERFGVDALQFSKHLCVVGKTALCDGADACSLHFQELRDKLLAMVGEVVGSGFQSVAVEASEGLGGVFQF